MSEREVLTMAAQLVWVLAAAAVPIDGDNVRSWLTHLAGNIFLAIVVVRGAIAIWRARLLQVLALGALAVLCAVFVYAPDVFQGLSQSMVTMVRGG